MPIATVTAMYVNDVQEGRRNGSIKTPQGEYYGVPPAMLSQFTKGGTYEVEYTADVSKANGRTYKNIKRVVSAAAPATRTSTGGTGAPVDKETAERIFVCGAMNAAIRAGQIDVNNGADPIAGVIHVLRDAWQVTFGMPKAPTQPVRRPVVQDQGQQYDEDLNDQVPF